ncbi:hypothetical protein Purlil1_8856 [Purpureocillium lilacinum]|uniref:Uncharacterized protein n=1 Tax=Purpureocillium lilacinum TaxID=33203 RepID=A0ABR0BS88_PURLI|nr:hypothetical protein Purlil1_8856 [Purpureocillium lilacinum]
MEHGPRPSSTPANNGFYREATARHGRLTRLRVSTLSSPAGTRRWHASPRTCALTIHCLKPPGTRQACRHAESAKEADPAAALTKHSYSTCMAHVCAALRCAAFRCYYRHNRDQWNAPVSSVSAGYGNCPSTPIFIAGVGFPLIDTVPHVHAVGSVFDRRNSPMWRRRLASVGYAILSGYLYLYTPAFRCPWGMDNDADMAAQAPSTSAESRDPLAPAQGPPALQAITGRHAALAALGSQVPAP